LEFFALSLVAEVGAAFAGFATIAGVIGRDDMQADSIFDIVLHCLIAVVFALVAIAVIGTGGFGHQSLRGIALVLLAVSVLGIAREVHVYRASWRDMPEEEKTGGLGRALGVGALLSMLPSPVLAAVVAAGFFSARAAFLYELALLSHLLVALFLLLYLVWVNFALRARPPAAG
jgi:hypothetical protein